MSKQLLFFFLIRNCSKKTVCIKISFLKSSWTNRKFRGTKRKREGLCILRLFEINVFFFCKTDVFQPINNQFLFDCVCGVAKKLLLSVDSTFFKPSCWPPFTHTHTHTHTVFAQKNQHDKIGVVVCSSTCLIKKRFF